MLRALCACVSVCACVSDDDALDINTDGLVCVAEECRNTVCVETSSEERCRHILLFEHSEEEIFCSCESESEFGADCCFSLDLAFVDVRELSSAVQACLCVRVRVFPSFKGLPLFLLVDTDIVVRSLTRRSSIGVAGGRLTQSIVSSGQAVTLGRHLSMLVREEGKGKEEGEGEGEGELCEGGGGAEEEGWG